MEKVRELMKNPLYTAIAAGVVGLLLGWFVIGWGIWPVTWYDAAPSNLRQDLKLDYLRMAVDSYAKNPDAVLARKRVAEFGSDGSRLIDSLKATPGINPLDVDKFKLAVTGALPPAVTTPLPGQTAVPGTKPVGAVTTPAPTQDGGGSGLLLVLCLVLLIVGAVLAYLLVFRNRKGAGFALPAFLKPRQATARPVAQVEYTEQTGEEPISRFMTTYKLGIDLYDDSFSIDSPTGEFLGECGVGISETIGVGDPKKVTAFEVWLFDKNDIQTVTKVMMSDYAFNDPAIMQRLASKGEPVTVEPGKQILLETATLQLEARVVDMNYGAGALPAGSFFDRLTLELAVWPKPK